MHKRLGFTVLELMVVIIVIGILLTIATLSFRSMQVTARDKEREADVETIVSYLENIYSQQIKKADGSVLKLAGSYPSREILYTSNRDLFDVVFSDLAKNAIFAPDTDVSKFSFRANNNAYNQTGINASNISPQEDDNLYGLNSTKAYIYVPYVTWGGNTCTGSTQECRAFQIYYKLESGEVKVRESKRK